MNRKRFIIGDIVLVSAHHVAEAVYKRKRANTRVHTRKKFKELVQGTVTGIKRMQTGQIILGGYDEQGYLEVYETKHYWSVKFGMTNKEVFVDDEDIVLVRSIKKSCSDWPKQKMLHYFHPAPWSIESRMMLREIALTQNRDESGRFMKGIKND